MLLCSGILNLPFVYGYSTEIKVDGKIESRTFPQFRALLVSVELANALIYSQIKFKGIFKGYNDANNCRSRGKRCSRWGCPFKFARSEREVFQVCHVGDLIMGLGWKECRFRKLNLTLGGMALARASATARESTRY